MKELGAKALVVTLRPDSLTELHLELNHRNGEVEAVIRCERGNFQELNAQWSQLQDSMAQQKVRLAPLQDANSANAKASNDLPMNMGQSGQGREFSNRPSQSGNEPANDTAFSRFPGESNKQKTTKKNTPSRHSNWESWA